MAAAIEQLESALSLARSMAKAATNAQAAPNDIASQERLVQALSDLTQPGVLLHAPAGIGLVSREALCMASGGESVAGRVEISAPDELVLTCGGAYIRLKGGEIEVGAPGNICLKGAHVQRLGGASLDTPVTPIPAGYSAGYRLSEETSEAMQFARYRITTQQGEMFNGVTDKEGRTMPVHTLLPGDVKIEFPETTPYDEQLRLVGPNGELASNLRYSASLADGSVLEGVTNEQGYTQRLVTKVPTRITRLTLFPPEGMAALCCAAQNAQAPLEIDLTVSNISTNDTDVGSSIQNVPLPKGKKRDLTLGEIAMARTVFKDAVKYGKVKVHHGGWWLFVGFQNTAVTPNGEMYYPESTKYYKDDFSKTDDNRDKALFMHEMTHVWQYQLGYPVKKAGLTVTSQGATAYQYSLKGDGRLSDYNMEQQGEIVSDFYIICIIGEPRYIWNPDNMTKSSKLLASTLEEFLANPYDKANLRDEKLMIKLLICAIGVLCFFIKLPTYATSFGYRGDADLESINGVPSICLRKGGKALSVGWVTFTESYVQGSAGWGARLKPGSKPLILEPGACLELGVVPDGFELDGFRMRKPLFPLEANKTYVFRLNDAHRPRDSYTAIFCVKKSTDGTIKYVQYIRLPDGREIIPSCDAEHNRSTPLN